MPRPMRSSALLLAGPLLAGALQSPLVARQPRLSTVQMAMTPDERSDKLDKLDTVDTVDKHDKW